MAAEVEDAITRWREIQAAIIRHDLPLQLGRPVPLMTTLLGTDGDEAVANDPRLVNAPR